MQAARAEADKLCFDNRWKEAPCLDHLPNVGFDVGNVLSPAGEVTVFDPAMISQVNHVRWLVGEERLFVVSWAGVKRKQEAVAGISANATLAACFPPGRRFFSMSNAISKEAWKLEVCRKHQIEIMVDDSFRICRHLRYCGVRCFRPVPDSCSSNDLDFPDNFPSPIEASRALLVTLLELRRRLQLPDVPFDAFQHASESTLRELPKDMPKPATTDAIASRQLAAGAETVSSLLSLEDSLEGWRTLSEKSAEQEKLRSQVGGRASEDFTHVDPPSCLGPHLHQPAAKRIKTLSFDDWRGRCFHQAAAEGCIACVKKWLDSGVSATWKSPNAGYTACDWIDHSLKSASGEAIKSSRLRACKECIEAYMTERH